MDRDEEVYSVYELMLENEEMLKMFVKMRNSNEEVVSYISQGLIPYISMLVEGNNSLLGGIDVYSEIDGKQFEKIIKKTRVRAKLYSSERLAKSLKFIDSTLQAIEFDLTHNYNSIQRMFIQIFGQEVLGVFDYKDKNILNNFLGYGYCSEFFDVQRNENLQNSINGADIKEFASNASNYISSMYSIYDIDKTEKIINDESKFDIELNELSMNDYYLIPSKKRNFFNKKDIELSVFIFLFNIKCAINYSILILPKLINPKSSLFLRITLIVYISSIESLEKLRQNTKRKTGSHEFKELIEGLIDRKRQFISQELRNEIFHYEFSISALSEINKGSRNPFIHLVEKRLGLSNQHIQKKIESEFQNIVQLIDDWIIL